MHSYKIQIHKKIIIQLFGILEYLSPMLLQVFHICFNLHIAHDTGKHMWCFHFWIFEKHQICGETGLMRCCSDTQGVLNIQPQDT